MTYNIFLSYSSKDIETARRIKQYFTQVPNTAVFLAETELILGKLDPVLIQAIQQSELFLVLYSKDSQASAYVQQEIGIAIGSNKIIVPLLLDPEAKPDAMIKDRRYLSIHDEQKRNEQMPRLYNYVLQESQKKRNNEALLTIGAIFFLSYAFSKGR